MQQTTERPEARPKQGLLQRLLFRGHGVPPVAERPAGEAETAYDSQITIDLREDIPARQWRAAVSDRLERLEEGMSLVAHTMKRAFSQVYRSIDDLRVTGSGPPEKVERILEESVASLKEAVEDLSESIHRVPYVLAAAADDITGQLENVARQSPPQAAPISTEPPDPQLHPQSESLPAIPFELEPVENQFAPMDEDSEDLAPQKS
jgi:hypothetical protein